MPGKKNVTLSDVAAVAGVSLSTASKALNGGGRISERTIIRVEEAAARLDFHPNALAQSFARGRSQTIGILTQNAVGTWSAPIVVGAVSYLGRHEQAALLYDAQFDTATLNANIRKLRARRIDGVLIIGDGPHYTLRSVTAEFSVPVAYVFSSTDDSQDTSYVPDGFMAGHLAGQHLVEIGRRRIAHITAAEDIAATERAKGLRAALDEANLEVVAHLDTGGSWTEEWGEAGTTDLLSRQLDVDAIFCGNDHIARGAERVLREHGLRVPDDIALVGVDNWEGVIVGQGGHHLTTVDTQLSALGAAAARDVTTGVIEPGRHAFPGSLVVGESTIGSQPTA